MASPVNRPLSPFMFPIWYRFQVTSALSILHRLTGIALAVGSILLAWWLVSVAAGGETFAAAHAFIASAIGLLLLFGWSIAFFLASRGYRCIAHDRRGHGRLSQPWESNDLDTYADDLAELAGQLDLHDAIHVGHSTGGGEVARYIGRHGTGRVAKAVLIGAIPPLMLKTDSNSGGLTIVVFDQLRAGVQADRSQFFKDLSMPFYGYNRPGAKVSEGVRNAFWLQSMMAGFPACYFCIKAFSETDTTEDLKKFDVPTLIMHGDDDQIVPTGAAAMLSSKIVKGARLKVYKGAPHGMCTTLKDQVNEELLAFFKESTAAKAA